MKIFTSLLCATALLTVGRQASAQTLYDNFENTRIVLYPTVEGTFVQDAANPGANTVNNSPTCAAYTRTATPTYAIIGVKPIDAKMADVADYIAGTKHITIKFRSPAIGIRVEAVLQNGAKSNTMPYPAGKLAGEFFAVTTVANAWETLSFNLNPADANNKDASVTSADIDQMVFQVAPGTATTGTFYLDDIMGPELIATTPTPTPAAPVLLDNFETTRLLLYPSVQGTLDENAANPGSTTVNSSATCASYVRAADQQYATINMMPKAGKFGDVSGYTTTTGGLSITMKFRSPAIGTKVQLVLQNNAKAAAQPYVYPQGNLLGTFDATTTTANAWEVLTFTFSTAQSDATVTATDIDQIAMLIAPGEVGATNPAAGATYYFDDLMGPAPLATATATRTAQTAFAAFAPLYPNPASGTTRLPYSLQKAATVSLAVFDNMGRRVAQVLDQQRKPAGQFSADLSTTRLVPGLYTCRLLVDGVALTRQLSVQ